MKRQLSMTNEKYHLSARLMHWIMAVGFVFMWGCGYAMTTLVAEDSPLEEFLFDLHISVGVTLLALLVLRIAIRLLHRPPPLPDSIRGLERTAAHLGHAALYALPAMVIAVGWAETNFAGHAVQWFGVETPRAFPETGEDLQDLSGPCRSPGLMASPSVDEAHMGHRAEAQPVLDGPAATKCVPRARPRAADQPSPGPGMW